MYFGVSFCVAVHVLVNVVNSAIRAGLLSF